MSSEHILFPSNFGIRFFKKKKKKKRDEIKLLIKINSLNILEYDRQAGRQKRKQWVKS